MIKITEQHYDTDLKHSLQEPLPYSNSIALWWLGQAGFALRYGNILIYLDPYLSDILARKYKDHEFPHTRMMPPPILPDEVANLNLLFCSHGHSDHTDPAALPVIAQNNNECIFVIPRAEKERVLQLGIPGNQIKTLNAGESFVPADRVIVQAIPAAHEDIAMNENREHHYLGYILIIGNVTIYHSGDCVPYPGLEDELTTRSIDIALLPVNGRDEYRRSRNIMGNFALAEAVELCEQAHIPIMLGHHFGMFDFNTINVEEAEQRLQEIRGSRKYFLTKMGVKYLFSMGI